MDQQFDLRGILGLLRRQFRLILITVLVVLAGAFAVVLALRPVYTATTLVLVDPTHKDLLDPESQLTASSSDSARVDSEVELVKSETTLLKVIDQLKLVDDPEFGVELGLKDTILAFLRLAPSTPPTGDDALQAVMDKLRDALTVQRRGLTFLISISARSRNPQMAAKIANTVADAYIQSQLDAKVTATLASRNIIQSRIAESSTAVADSERSFDNFIQNNLTTITQQTGRTDIADLGKQLNDIDASRTSDAQLADVLDKSLQSQDWNSVANELKSDAVQALAAQRQQLVASLNTATAGSQDAINLKAELSKLESQLGTEAQTELTSLRQKVTDAQAQATDVRQQLRTSVLGANLPAEVLTSIYELQQNAEIARSQYQTLLQRMKDLEAQAYLQVADSRVASTALPPAKPSFPNPPLILALAGLAALALGLGLAFLVENYVGGFTSDEQLQAMVRADATATVPRQRDKSGNFDNGVGVADHVITSPLSVFAEAVRRVRLALDQAMNRSRPTPADGEHGSVIMVTSAAANEGKTTMALSIARAYAMAGRSTLLIDCDLRKPGIHWQLGLEPSTGLLEYLANDKDAPPLPSIMAIDEGSGAQIIVGSRRSDVATDQLLSGATFARLVAAARESFDVVVLDTPPVGPVVDALYLIQHADVAAFVVRWATTSQQDVRHAVKALQEARRNGTEIVTVLNRQDVSRSTYYNKYAGYYSEA